MLCQITGFLNLLRFALVNSLMVADAPQICTKNLALLWIWSNLRMKYLMESLIFCAVQVSESTGWEQEKHTKTFNFNSSISLVNSFLSRSKHLP